MINTGTCSLTGYPMAIFSPEEQTAALAVNGLAIEWLEKMERDATKELGKLRKDIRLRKRCQKYYRKNNPMLSSLVEHQSRVLRPDYVEVVRSGVVAFPVCRMFTKNGPVNEPRETYPETPPGYGSEIISEGTPDKNPVDNSPGETV
jgi:hypothetical protein